jgi:microcystin-dependent protein
LNVTGDSSFSGDLTISDLLTTDSLTVSNDASIGGNATVSGILTVSNNTTIGGILTVSQIQTSSGNLTINTAIGSSVAIQTNTTVSGTLTADYVDAVNVVPIGTIQMWCGAEIGVNDLLDNWLPCNGAELAIADYPVLYNRITYSSGGSGTFFPHGANTDGSGNPGSTHFRIPDLRGRFTVGAGIGASFTENGTLLDSGFTGGSANGSVIDHEHFVASSSGYEGSGTDPKVELTDDKYVSTCCCCSSYSSCRTTVL